MGMRSVAFGGFGNYISLGAVAFRGNSGLGTFAKKRSGGCGVLNTFLSYGSLAAVRVPTDMRDLKATFGNSSLEAVAFRGNSGLGSVAKNCRGGSGCLNTLSSYGTLAFVRVPTDIRAVRVTTFGNYSSLRVVAFRGNSGLRSVSKIHSLKTFSKTVGLAAISVSRYARIGEVSRCAFCNGSGLQLFGVNARVPPAYGSCAFCGVGPCSILGIPSKYASTCGGTAK